MRLVFDKCSTFESFFASQRIASSTQNDRLQRVCRPERGMTGEILNEGKYKSLFWGRKREKWPPTDLQSLLHSFDIPLLEIEQNHRGNGQGVHLMYSQ